MKTFRTIRVELVVLVALAGCLRDPDVSKLVCQANDQCPTGYWCTTAHKCTAGQGPADASSGVSVDQHGADGNAPVDVGTIDASSKSGDTPVAEDATASATDVASDFNSGTGGSMETVDGSLPDTRAPGAWSVDATDTPLPGTGGAGGAGGTIATGGSTSSGGVVSTGGVAGTGGTAAATGGAASTGGIAGSGGVVATGGTTSAAPVINSFTATPATITAGKTATLNWSITGATKVSIGGVGTVTGTSWAVIPTQTTTYLITAQNATGDSVTAQAVVTVVAAPTITSFTADATTIAPAATTKLTPVFSNGSGTIAPSIGSVTSGSQYSTGGLTAKTVYTLTVTNEAGDSVTAQTTIQVVGFLLTGSMTTPRMFFTMTTLSNGQVLVAGGNDGTKTQCLSSAELYDPGTRKFSAIPNAMTAARCLASATLLANGKVLLTGGYVSDSSSLLATAELFDPTTNAFTPTASPMSSARTGHSSTFLTASGRVLIVGGWAGGSTFLTSAELYNSADGTFAPVYGTLTTGRQDHTATLLANGGVLIAGGTAKGLPLASVELYDPGSQWFTALSSTMSLARTNHTAVLLTSGKVLIAGGSTIVSATNGGYLDTAELFDPSSGSGGSLVAVSSKLSSPRTMHTASILRNGQVLLAGGSNGVSLLASAELYDPTTGATGSFNPGSPLNVARSWHRTATLADGSVLIAGGTIGNNAGSVLASAELYIY